jgi:polar amino acid transport system substrate-binding protein
MKKSVIIALALFGILLAACSGAQAPAPAAPAGVTTDLGGREVRIAVENAYPPFNRIDADTNEGVGWDYDTWREICDRLNCTPVFVEAAWDGLFEAMSFGEYDVAADGITIKWSRAGLVDFSDPYMNIGQVILVRVDETDITGEDALVSMEEKLVGVQIGTTNEEAALKLVSADRLRSFDTFDLPVLALISGDVDAVVIDTVAAVGFMDENPGEMKIAGDPITSGELLGFAYPPKSDLLVAVNWALQEMQNDGTLDQLCMTWIQAKCDASAE